VNVECNNKMVRNNEDRRRTNRWFPEDRGQREYMYKGLCQGANMLASGAGPVTVSKLCFYFPCVCLSLPRYLPKARMIHNY
jgi:hypothetical protein